MMMLMGGTALVATLLIPLIGVVMLIIAIAASVTGHSTELLERLLPPGILPETTRKGVLPSEGVKRASYNPVGTRHGSAEGAAAPARYTRRCQECGQVLQRGWEYCPGCGEKLFWV